MCIKWFEMRLIRLQFASALLGIHNSCIYSEKQVWADMVCDRVLPWDMQDHLTKCSITELMYPFDVTCQLALGYGRCFRIAFGRSRASGTALLVSILSVITWGLVLHYVQEHGAG
jgi:hypothetical protein